MSQYFRLTGLVAAIVVGASLRPNLAEAQARGTLQVSAQVVDPSPSYEGLRIAKSALSTKSDAVSTLAHVSVTYPVEQRQVVVVTIDYSHN
jgi:hypothetical protein